jgi:hypothetical protein
MAAFAGNFGGVAIRHQLFAWLCIIVATGLNATLKLNRHTIADTALYTTREVGDGYLRSPWRFYKNIVMF